MIESDLANIEIADVLERVSDLLEVQGANRFRVRAYRTASDTIRRHEVPLARILREGGVEAVDALPTLGPTMAAHDGRLERVRAFGSRRVRAVREALSSILGRSARHRARRRAWLAAHTSERRDADLSPRPAAPTLLAVDADYRARAGAGKEIGL